MSGGAMRRNFHPLNSLFSGLDEVKAMTSGDRHGESAYL